jgi:hypothetical protein
MSNQTPPAKKRNLTPLNATLADLKWDTETDRKASLSQIHNFAINHTTDAINWYYKHKRKSSLFAYYLRVTAFVFATLGAAIPLIVRPDYLVTSTAPAPTTGFFNHLASFNWFNLHNLGYILLATAAAAIALDRLLGFTASWIRYVLTAQLLQQALNNFTIEWNIQASNLNPQTPLQVQPQGLAPPQPVPDTAPAMDNARCQALLAITAKFIATVLDHVQKETAEWANDFRTSLSSLEHSAAARPLQTSPSIATPAPTPAANPFTKTPPPQNPPPTDPKL